MVELLLGRRMRGERKGEGWGDLLQMRMRVKIRVLLLMREEEGVGGN